MLWDILLDNRNIKRSEEIRKRKRMRGGVERWEAWCLGGGRRILGSWQFPFVDLGGGYMDVYLDIIVILWVFVLYTPLYEYSTSQ